MATLALSAPSSWEWVENGYTALKGGKVTVDQRGGKLIANDVMVLLKKLGTVDAKVEGRIVIQ